MQILKLNKNKKEEVVLLFALLLLGILMAYQFYTRQQNSQMSLGLGQNHELLRDTESLVLAMKEAEASASFFLFVQGIGCLLIFALLLYILGNIRRQRKDRLKLIEELDKKNREYVLNNGQPLQKENEIITSLVTNLQNAKEFIRRIGTRDFETDLAGLSKDQYHLNKDNIAGALLNVRELLKEKEKEESSRKWANEGIAQFSEIIRKHNHSLDLLANEVLKSLIKYLNANQGALYILNKEGNEEFLEMTACYAWNKKKYIHDQIRKGEGLAGQAWQERDLIYLTEVPDSYVRISSGLGEANPTSILIMPLKNNEEVLGVLELASFNKLSDFEIDFIKKISESIASALSSVKINERTRQLLQNSQEQTEEMRAQEEEMRQNMEEMQATQEEMRRQEVEIRGQLIAVNNTMASIEFDLQGHVQNANQNFLKVMGYSLEEIKGCHHRIFCDSDYANSKEYQALWENLNKGISISEEFKRITKHGKEVWLRATYTPVLDHSGNPLKILKFALEITEEKLLNLDIQAKMKAIDRSSAIIEFTPDGKVLKANEQFLRLMKYQETEIIGKHHELFVPAAVRATEAYKEHWKKLKSGEFLEGEFLRKDKNEKEIWIRATYSPVLDFNGKTIKVVKVAQDITMEKSLNEKIRLSVQ